MQPFDPEQPIAALATPPGNGALGVIRISGKDSFRVGQKLFKGKKSLTEMTGYEAARRILDANGLRRYFRRSAEAISLRGKARANDRTMLDALLWAADAMENCDTDDIAVLLKAGWDGACAGAEATKSMLPRLGRAKNFRFKALGYPDPGAVSTSIIFRGLYEAVSQEEK